LAYATNITNATPAQNKQHIYKPSVRVESRREV